MNPFRIFENLWVFLVALSLLVVVVAWSAAQEDDRDATPSECIGAQVFC